MRAHLTISALVLTIASSTAAAQDSHGGARICLVPTRVETAVGNSGEAVSAVRETFTSFLTGPSISVSPLKARLESQAREEAKAAKCPYMLLTSIEHERKGGSGFLGRVAGSAVQQSAWTVGSAVGSAGGRVVAGAAAGAAGAVASDYAYSTQKHDQLTLTTRLESADGRVLVDKSDKRKADSDGEDLLTPIVQKHAEAIAAAVASHK
jgi:outer membrane lipoprotein SlyB